MTQNRLCTMIRKTLLFSILCSLFISGFQDAHSQIIKTRLDIVGGLAFVEYAHAGLRYQYGPSSQVGLYYGGDLNIKPEIITNWTAEHVYHFGKNNFYSNRPVWYTRQGFTISKQLESGSTYKIGYLQLSIGYEFPLTNHLGLNFDMGLNCKVRQKTVESSGTVRVDPSWYLLPLARLQLYVSL